MADHTPVALLIFVLTGPVVAFSRKKGLMKQVLITPDEPGVFVETLKIKVRNAQKTK